MVEKRLEGKQMASKRANKRQSQVIAVQRVTKVFEKRRASKRASKGQQPRVCARALIYLFLRQDISIFAFAHIQTKRMKENPPPFLPLLFPPRGKAHPDGMRPVLPFLMERWRISRRSQSTKMQMSGGLHAEDDRRKQKPKKPDSGANRNISKQAFAEIGRNGPISAHRQQRRVIYHLRGESV